MFVDIPKDKLLPLLEKQIIEQMQHMMSSEEKKVVIEKVEWTSEGLRVWIQNML